MEVFQMYICTGCQYHYGGNGKTIEKVPFNELADDWHVLRVMPLKVILNLRSKHT